MTLKPRIVAALLRLYPAVWRREYGPELTDMLIACPLEARIVGDVLWNGLRQRVRAAAPSTLFGLAVMLGIFTALVWNIAAPPVGGRAFTDVLQPSTKTLPAVIVRPLGSELYLWVLLWCGCWTHLRHRGTLSQSGLAAVRLSLIAAIPVMLAGVLMLVGALNIVGLEPGQTPSTLYGHGLTYTYYSAHRRALTPVGVLLSPLLKLPESWLWGVFGGLLGRAIARSRDRRTARS